MAESLANRLASMKELLNSRVYLSTYHYRAFDCQLVIDDIVLWFDILSRAGINAPLFLICDLGALMIGQETQLTDRASNGWEQQIYLTTAKNWRESSFFQKVAEMKLSPRVAGQLLAKLFAGLEFHNTGTVPLEFFERELRAYLNPFATLELYPQNWREDEIYPDVEQCGLISKRLLEIDFNALTGAVAFGDGTAIKREKLGGLLSQLIKLPNGQMMLSLVMRLLPLINLGPIGAGSQPFTLGGYNDISRHGDLSNILISELAYPEEEFLRRFVENELLYYKREAPPKQRPRVIIYTLDGGPMMWGSPRVLAAAGAIALAIYAERHQDKFRLLLGPHQPQLYPLESVEDLTRLLNYRHWEQTPINLLNALPGLLEKETAERKEVIIGASAEFYDQLVLDSSLSILGEIAGQANLSLLQCQAQTVAMLQWQESKDKFLQQRSINIPAELLQHAIGEQTVKAKQPTTTTPIGARREALLQIGHLGKISQLVCSADGRYLASIGTDDTLRLWLLDNGAPIWREFHSNNIPITLAFSASKARNWLAIAFEDGSVQVREVPTGVVVCRIKLEFKARRLAFSSYDDQLVIATAQNLQFWDIFDNSQAKNILNYAEVTQIYFSPNGKWLVLRCNNHLRVLSTADYREVSHNERPFKFAGVSDERIVAFNDEHFYIYRLSVKEKWNTAGDAQSRISVAPNLSQSQGWFSHDGEDGFMVNAEGDVTWYKLYTQHRERIFSTWQSDGEITAITASSERQLLVMAMANGSIEVKRWLDGETKWRISGAVKRNVQFSAGAKGYSICVNDEQKGIYRWHLQKQIAPDFSLLPDVNIKEIRSAFISPDERYYLLANSVGAWSIADLLATPNKRKFLGPRNYLAWAFSPDSSYIALITNDHKLEIYNSENGERIYWCNAIPNKFLLSMSPQRCAFLEEPGVIAVFDIGENKIIYRLRIGKLLSMKISDDGQRLQVLTNIGHFESWNIGGDRVFSQLIDLKGNTRARILDNSRVVIYGKDSNLHLINRTSGKQAILGGHLGGIADCLILGEMIASVDRSGCLRLFDKNLGNILLTLYLDSPGNWVAFHLTEITLSVVGSKNLVHTLRLPYGDEDDDDTLGDGKSDDILEMLSQYQR